MYEIETIIPLALVIGVLMGAGITWALLKNSASQVTERVSHEYESDLAVLEEKLFSRENELSRLNADHARLGAELDEQVRQSTDLKVQASRLQTLLDEAREQADEKMRILRDAKEQMRLDFQNLANEILEDKTHRFAEQNQANIDNLLSPLQKEIGDFRHKVEEAYISDTKDRAVLFNEISRLKELNQQISQDAVNLTKALTRDSKAQGNWGELVLEKILEESGLSRGREFDIVSSGYYDQQEPYQPDVIVHLPDGRDVVIDSKINLSAYQNFRSMDDDGQRQDFLQEHLQVFRRHIRGLREKNFEKIEGVRSLDYVIMFVPVESALLPSSMKIPNCYMMPTLRESWSSVPAIFCSLYALSKISGVMRTRIGMPRKSHNVQPASMTNWSGLSIPWKGSASISTKPVRNMKLPTEG